VSALALERVIAAMAGPDARPRPDQVCVVVHLVEGGRGVLVVQVTGWGKSAVYWAATAVLRAKGAGPTLVVSPLLALMAIRSQLRSGRGCGRRG
jgi:ATP-dependent DNA helicase RecQ